MKTTLQELIEQLERTIPEIKNNNAIDKTFWLEKEKQQIIEARENGFYSSENWIGDSEKYYNETYGK